LPLFEVDQGTRYDLPDEWSGVATQWGLLQILLCEEHRMTDLIFLVAEEEALTFTKTVNA
jgi:hypothetical protein